MLVVFFYVDNPLMSKASLHRKIISLEPSAPTFRWMKGALIGSGTFYSVYLGLNSVTGQLMAVKQVELPTGQSDKEDGKQSIVRLLLVDVNRNDSKCILIN